jgi:hypothetical protein
LLLAQLVTIELRFMLDATKQIGIVLEWNFPGWSGHFLGANEKREIGFYVV